MNEQEPTFTKCRCWQELHNKNIPPTHKRQYMPAIESATVQSNPLLSKLDWRQEICERKNSKQRNNPTATANKSEVKPHGSANPAENPLRMLLQQQDSSLLHPRSNGIARTLVSTRCISMDKNSIPPTGWEVASLLVLSKGKNERRGR
ncbi:hypothetical protein CEXT_337411 [Caerostris extrusa]|uniref:Uncharacterized protein n=1 Tax=Caerostris extrusa TaxID=172846 RepID=A0AAV4N3X8_CAEEX|nr:hypothetical protein CEXT_337411 [Caerostris extrusa]